ncbi:dTDP-4-dehydrorhamnose reductase [Aeoliella mucimassa]|uniref:dTDP-4-dehydrorhamnose reductase n=1 Tax=Aeoliella mucimassa TaxID=2527972 RepID=A0A518AQB3_9BACT|nr:dTDP-4-dehydrorhamnose reductase [Aeoliella mucimassa]QDU56911.1 dTDP-4-dehydrorhamnose reductase [Aeoliella mucimassa]
MTNPSDSPIDSLPYQRILVTGVKGQLGTDLSLTLGEKCLGFDRDDFDLTEPSETREHLLRAAPDLVINTAAYTAVDKAEENESDCFAVNADAVANLAEVCEELACPLVQISTDYVFGGDKQRKTPYLEDDTPDPQGVYAKSKLAGEQAASTWREHLIVRTCGLYSVHPDGPIRGRNFCDTMLSLGRNNTPLRVVDDQWCTPTFVPHLSQMIFQLLARNERGVFHATADGQTTWFQLAKELFSAAGLDVELTPIPTSEYPTPAERPQYSVLASSKPLERPDWRLGCREYAALQSAS